MVVVQGATPSRKTKRVIRLFFPLIAYARKDAKTQKRKERKAGERNLRFSAALLDVVLARLLLAPGNDDDALVVERRHEVFPAAHLAQAREVRLLRALEHVRLDGVEQLRDGLGDVGERGGRFGAGVAADGERLGLGEVLGADLEAEGDTLCNDDKLATGSVGT